MRHPKSRIKSAGSNLRTYMNLLGAPDTRQAMQRNGTNLGFCPPFFFFFRRASQPIRLFGVYRHGCQLAPPHQVKSVKAIYRTTFQYQPLSSPTIYPTRLDRHTGNTHSSKKSCVNRIFQIQTRPKYRIETTLNKKKVSSGRITTRNLFFS